MKTTGMTMQVGWDSAAQETAFFRPRWRGSRLGAWLALVVAGLIALAGVAQATDYSGIINYAFWGAPDSGQGVIGGTNAYWNQIFASGTTSGDLTSTGDPTGITFSDTSPLSFQGPADAFVPLLTHYLLTGGVATETLHNVQPGSYDLYLYGQNGTYNGRGAVFTFDGVSESAINRNGSGTAFVEGANYVVFTNITLASAGSITFTYAGGPGVGGEGNFNGLQLQLVPEPSTCLLFGLGAIGGTLLAIRRKQRG